MLLEDEQHVIKWLSQYGALPKTQILQMLYNKPRSTAEKIIRNLIAGRRSDHVVNQNFLSA